MRIVQVFAAVGAVVAGSLLLGVPEAGAAGPSITVTPSTGLIDGQTVTVSGSGWTFGLPDVLGINECANVPSPGNGDCGSGTGAGYGTSTNNFVETYTVSRFITTGNQGTVDCAVPHSCLLTAFAPTNPPLIFEFQSALTPIEFTKTLPNFRILNARLIRRVLPGEPVVLWVRAVNNGPIPANWGISQSSDVGLTALRATCPGGSAQGPGLCVYSPAERGVGQPANAFFTLEAAPGFTGTASATVCATDLDSQGSAPPSNMCDVLTTTVG
jgi:hypothetical protein